VATLSHAYGILDKEVEGYYEDGMRVPDDVTLLWADDKYASRMWCLFRDTYSKAAGEMSGDIRHLKRETGLEELEFIITSVLILLEFPNS